MPKRRIGFDLAAIKQAAAGRWPEILSSLGGLPADFLHFDNQEGPCPKCGGSTRYRGLDEVAGALFCSHCFSAQNGDGIAALQWLTDKPFLEVVAALAEHLGIACSGDSNGKTARKGNPPAKRPDSEITATFNYRDERFLTLFQVVRYDDPKDFRQRAPRPGGGWTWKTKGIRKVPYRLPELLAAGIDTPKKVVLIPEGEKHVARLVSLGFLATCNPGGAGKWLPAYSPHFAGRNVAILSDNDEVGRQHGEQVAASLHGTAAAVKVILLPGLPPKGDVLDWLDAGGTADQLREIIKAAPLWQPPAAPATTTGVAPEAIGNASNAAPTGIVEADDDPHRLARIFMAEQNTHRLLFWRQEWWQYDGQRYLVIPDEEIRGHLTASVKGEMDRLYLAYKANGEAPEFVQRVTRSLFNNVFAIVTNLATLKNVKEQPCWLSPDSNDPHTSPPAGTNCIAMQNGILDMDALMADADEPLLPHSPLWFSPICLSYPFDPDAGNEPPIFLRIHHENCDGVEAKLAALQEWMGYCLTHDTSQQRFVAIEGEGSNGKSVYLAALEAILGYENVSHVSLESFGERFALTPTIGKLANITGDTGDIDKLAEGHLKQFTGGERMSFDRKGLAPIDAAPTARLILSWNNRPRFNDKSNGVWRRMLLLLFNHVVPADQRIRGMDKPAWWIASGELPAIFNWAVVGLDRLSRNGVFTVPNDSREAMEEYKLEVNPARSFLFDNCESTHDATIASRELYRYYREWCTEGGYHPLGEKQFGKEVKRAFPMSQRKKGGSRSERFWYYKNLSYQGMTAGSLENDSWDTKPSQRDMGF